MSSQLCLRLQTQSKIITTFLNGKINWIHSKQHTHKSEQHMSMLNRLVAHTFSIDEQTRCILPDKTLIINTKFPT